MAKKSIRKLRRHYFRLMRMSFVDAVWFVGVVVVPGIWLAAVPFAQLACLAAHGIDGDSCEAVAGGVGMTGLGTLVFAAVTNHGSWVRQPNQLGMAEASRLIVFSIIRNMVWIGVGLAFFAFCGIFVAGFERHQRTTPMWTSFLVSWLAGFFAFLLVGALGGSERKEGGPAKPFRGRGILSGKDQAKKLASKKRWSL